MTTKYHDLLADVALRANAFDAPLPADIEAKYKTRPLTAALFNSADFSYEAMIAALAGAEEQLVNAIAATPDNEDRGYFTIPTAPLASGTLMPIAAAGGKAIIGVAGAVRDAGDFGLCTERPVQEIERLNLDAGQLYIIPAYFFKIVGNRIFHTRRNNQVVVDVCVYDYTSQIQAITTNTTMLLPDDLGEALICGAVATLVRDNEFAEQAGLYAGYFATVLARYGPTSSAEKAAPH
jgi:hypothetical protein